MATITGLTAERMLEIEAASVVDGDVVSGHLILTKQDGSTIDAGTVVGPAGPTGPAGPAGFSAIPGEVRMWSGLTLPAIGTYGRWVWADGAVYAVSSHPLAAANIATQWRTAHGASDPGGSNFRVPDLRGLTPVGLDQMPGGARANRMTRAVAITIAAKTGEETHIITVPEMPTHKHTINDPGHNHTYNNIVGSPANIAAGTNFTGSTQNTSTKTTGITLNDTGGDQGHENVQPSVFVPYIVALDG